MTDNNLGAMVTDLETGIEGVVNNRADYAFGQTRYCIQPKAEKGKNAIVDSIMVDECQVQQNSDQSESVKCIPVLRTTPKFKTGQIVIDPVNNFTGIIMGRAVYTNGCARVYIEGKTKKGAIKNLWLPEEQVVAKLSKILRKPVYNKDIRKAVNEGKRTKSFRGGPAPSSSRY